MCGIFGFISSSLSKPNISRLIEATQLLNHRGPDNFGYFENSSQNNYIFLGHQRLSIIDLKSSANQPMISS